MNLDENTAIAEVETEADAPLTPSAQILAPLELSDYSQFLYNTEYGGEKGQDFTYEGIKTLGLNNGISTGEVKIEFLDDEKTEALFYCTATDRNGDTSSVVIRQGETEYGRVNPNWIEKGCSRAIRNAIKARLPVQLFKTALQKAIAAGEAKQSAIIESQQELSVAWEERDESLCELEKRTFFDAAQQAYGESEYWDAETWKQVASDLNTLSDWVVILKGGRREKS